MDYRRPQNVHGIVTKIKRDLEVEEINKCQGEHTEIALKKTVVGILSTLLVIRFTRRSSPSNADYE
ncbi:MAG: hypothetical protein QOH96_3398 [Blastocatellia bacterium]|jgi:hypothetical protein|nr:hypothetical protein [Blastocatellia bacterium]